MGARVRRAPDGRPEFRTARRRHPHPRHRRPPRHHRRPAHREGHQPRRPRRAPRGPPHHPGQLARAAAEERPRPHPARVLQLALPWLQRRRAPLSHPGEPRLPGHRPHREIRTFRVAAASGLGTKRGRGRGCFIDPAMAAAAHEAEPTKPTSLGSTDYSSRTAPLTPRLLTLPPPSRRTRPEPPNRSSRMRHMRAPPTVRAPSGVHGGSGQLTSWLRSHSS